MFIIYDFIFLALALVYLPVYFLRGKVYPGFIQRWGILPKGLKAERPIWIHAVSVGEVMVVKGLLAELKSFYPNKQFLISTVTPTGNQIAKKLIAKNDYAIYLPLDLNFIIAKVLKRIDPEVFIIAETEIWPALIRQLSLRKIPIVIVNGRISNSSFRGYMRIRFFLKSFLNKITIFCVRTQLDADRLISLGAQKNKIQITGNMKFDINALTTGVDYRKIMDLEPQEKLLVAASTHPGEEEIILKVYAELTQSDPQLRLLIAPRHPERAEKVKELISQAGFKTAKVSTLDSPYNRAISKSRVFLLDTLGQLMEFYKIADIVFMGKSFVNKGGQNFLEPAFFAKPIMFGPSMSNFQEAADMFLQKKGAVLVHNPQELKSQVEYFLRNPGVAQEFGKIAQGLVLKNQGATKRNARLIFRVIAGEAKQSPKVIEIASVASLPRNDNSRI